MLRIAIFGTGGAGGIFGALFAKAGHSVSFIARGEHLRAIQSHGLKILSSSGDFEIQSAQATGDAAIAAQNGPFDLVLVCIKTWQLTEAREQLAPLVSARTLILPLQNGVEASEILTEAYPRNQILRGFCAVISYVEAPGVIRHVGIAPYLCLGEMESPHISPRILKLKQELAVPGLVLETPENLLTQQWQKFIFISSLAGITSLAGLPAGPLRDRAETRDLLKAAMQEVLDLGKAKGIPFPTDSQRVIEKAMDRVDEMPFDGTTSMQRDFQARRRTELETFSGYIVREGKSLHIPTPIHQTCYALLLAKISA